MKNKKWSIGLLVIFVIILAGALSKRISPLSWKLHKAVNQGMFDNQAINGFDPVAYISDQAAIEGKHTIMYSWNKANWYFSTEGHKARFIENPEQYIPQFGGYCSFAVSKGFTANTDPNVFAVQNGKIYLFASEDVKKDWLREAKESLNISNLNWVQ